MERDQMEQDQTRDGLHDTYAPSRCSETRSAFASISLKESMNSRSNYAWATEQGQPQLRLDQGHDQSRSRWFAAKKTGLSPARSGGSQSTANVAQNPSCLALVASREARVLAAMVNWMASVHSLDVPASHHDLATIAGRTIKDPTGLIQFCSGQSQSADRYLLAHPAEEKANLFVSRAVECRTIERYSLDPGLDWWAGDLRGIGGCYRFRAYQRGEFCTEVRLRVPGLHQVLPALAAVAIGTRMQLAPSAIKERLEDFSGVPRGFESRGSFRGATLVDDEALGTGAIGETIQLAREVFGRRRLRAIYLPHAGSFPVAAEFAGVDHLVVINTTPPWREWTRLLAATLRSSGATVVACATLDQATRALDRNLEPGDVLVTLGASEVGTIADAFLRRLSRDRHC